MTEWFTRVYTLIKSTKIIIHFLQFQLFHQNRIFVDIIVHLRSLRKENISGIPAHGIYRGVKLFLQPVKLRKISILRKINLAIFYKAECISDILSGKLFYFSWVSVSFGVPETLRLRWKVYLQSRHALDLYPRVQPKKWHKSTMKLTFLGRLSISKSCTRANLCRCTHL